MSKPLTNNAIIYAILALNSEIGLQKEYLDSGEIAENEKANENGILDDLEQALMEFIDLYKIRISADQSLPSLDELLNHPL